MVFSVPDYVIVSECAGKARARSSSVLDRYLPRIGSHTWSGSLSLEGVEDIRRRLASSASRNMAVCCHRSGHVAPEWFVGSRDGYDLDGTVPIAASSHVRENSDNPQSPRFNLLKSVVVIAALLHDIGKASLHFQMKVRKELHLADSVRHEFISMLVFDTLIDGLPKRDCRILEHLASLSQEDLSERLRAALEAALLAVRDGKHHQPKLMPLILKDRPVVGAIRFLIVAHHHLPASRRTSNASFTDMHVATRFHAEQVKDYVPLQKSVCPTSDAGYIRLLKSGFSRLAEAFTRCEAGGGLHAGEVLPGLTPYGRLSLNQADHYISSKKSSELLADDFYTKGVSRLAVLSAKPVANLLHSKSTLFGQGLVDHLRRIGREAGCLMDALYHIDKLPRVPGREVPRQVANPDEAEGRFAWQRTAFDLIKEANPRNGFFGVITAGTGSGKTLGSAIIMSALSGGAPRYNSGLGLRTLSLQTLDALQRDAGYSGALAEHVGLHIGSPIVKALHDDAQDEHVSQKDGRLCGSAWTGEAASEEMASLLIGPLKPGGLRGCLARHARGTGGLESLQMLGTPILVSTTDLYRVCLQGLTGGELTTAFRFMSADLFLDEVDNYDAVDQGALSLLAHTAGLAGRRVVIASATLPPATAHLMWRAYHSGYQEYARLFGKDGTIDAGWFSDMDSAVLKNLQVDAFAPAHREHIGRLVAVAQLQPARRRAQMLTLISRGADGKLRPAPIIAEDTIKESVAHLGIQSLHRRNHIISDGRRFSIGLIRMNTIADCQEMAVYLATQENLEGVSDFRVVCYHSKHPLVMRHYIERDLDKLCSRKTDSHQLADTCRGLNGRDVTIIVVATSVEEVGRDHDFDWLIGDFNTYRQMVQASGRVGRHRPELMKSIEGDWCNVLIMPRHFATADQNSQSLNNTCNVNDDFGLAIHGYASTGCAAESITAAPMLDDMFRDKGGKFIPVAIKEHSLLQRRFFEGDTSAVTMSCTALARLTDACKELFPFRAGPEEVNYTLMPNAGSDSPWLRTDRAGSQSWQSVGKPALEGKFLHGDVDMIEQFRAIWNRVLSGVHEHVAAGHLLSVTQRRDENRDIGMIHYHLHLGMMRSKSPLTCTII